MALSLFLAGCGSDNSGGGELLTGSPAPGGTDTTGLSANVPPPDLAGLEHAFLSGRLVLPPESQVRPEDLLVYSTYGEQKASSDGSFRVPLSSRAPQAFAALDQTGEVRLLGIGNLQSTVFGQTASEPGELSARTTALSLAFLAPEFATLDRTDTGEIFEFLASLKEFKQLEVAIAQTFESNQLFTESPQVSAALEALLGAAGQALESRGRIAPDLRQSGVELVHRIDKNGSRRYLVRNYRHRWLDLWLDDQHIATMPGIDGLTLWKLVTFSGNDPQEEDVTAQVLERKENVTLAAWGPGAASSTEGYLAHAASATTGTVLKNLVGPAISIVSGSDIFVDNNSVKTFLQSFGKAVEISTLFIQASSIQDGLRESYAFILECMKDDAVEDILEDLAGETARHIFERGQRFFKVIDLVAQSSIVLNTVNDLALSDQKVSWTIIPYDLRLDFDVQPSKVDANTFLTPAAEVWITDQEGVLFDDLNEGVQVTLSIESGPAGASITGGSALTGLGGIAVFPNLTLDKPGEYTLKATAKVPGFDTSLESVSRSFTVVGEPKAADDSFQGFKNEPIETDESDGIFTNDTLNGGSLTSYDSQSTRGGTVSVLPNGSFTYTPPTDFVGTDTFTYTLSGGGGQSVATVQLSLSDTVPPLPQDDQYHTPVDVDLQVNAEKSLFLNDELRDGYLSDFQSTTIEGGTVSLSGADGTFVYSPPAGFSGQDSFTYRLRNQYGESDPSTVRISVGSAPEISFVRWELVMSEITGNNYLGDGQYAGGSYMYMVTSGSFGIWPVFNLGDNSADIAQVEFFRNGSLLGHYSPEDLAILVDHVGGAGIRSPFPLIYPIQALVDDTIAADSLDPDRFDYLIFTHANHRGSEHTHVRDIPWFPGTLEENIPNFIYIVSVAERNVTYKMKVHRTDGSTWEETLPNLYTDNGASAQLLWSEVYRNLYTGFANGGTTLE